MLSFISLLVLIIGPSLISAEEKDAFCTIIVEQPEILAKAVECFNTKASEQIKLRTNKCMAEFLPNSSYEDFIKRLCSDPDFLEKLHNHACSKVDEIKSSPAADDDYFNCLDKLKQ